MNRPISPLRERAAVDGGMEHALRILSRLAALVVGILAAGIVLHEGRVFLAPVMLAVVIGLMLGPVSTRLENTGLPPVVSAAAIVVAFIALIAGGILLVAMPLSEWSQNLPRVWANLQGIIHDWRDFVRSLDELRDGLKSVTGSGEAMTVEIDEGSAVAEAAWLAPAILMQIVVFLASLFFFLASRDDIRTLILSLCFERRLRWRVAHIFRDVEAMVSHYLLTITAVNAVLGVAVTGVLWLLGVPSPHLWGMLAAILNYIIYLGPALMALILLGVGLASDGQGLAVLVPAAAYLAINLTEAQFVTPQALGRTLTINPFVVFLSIGFWIWIWGPIGGFVAVPALLIFTAVARHVIPQTHRLHVREVNAALRGRRAPKAALKPSFR